MVSLSSFSIFLLFLINYRNETSIIEKLEEHANSLNKVSQLSLTQLTKEPDSDTVLLQQFITKLSREKGVYEVSVVNNEEKIVLSSNPERIGRLLGPQGTAELYSKEGKGKLKPGNAQIFVSQIIGTPNNTDKKYNVVVPLIRNNKRIGSVQILVFRDDFKKMFAAMRFRSMLTTFSIWTLATALIIFVAGRFLRPLKKLALATERISQGDFSRDIPSDGEDEVSHLARSFNQMTKSLRRYRKIEEQMHRANRLSALGQLAAGAAHEIRNPLNAIGFAADNLREDFSPEDYERRRDFFQIIRNIKEEIVHLDGIVKGLIDFSKPRQLHLRTEKVNAILKDTLSLMDREARGKGITIKLQLEGNLPDCRLDSEQIRQAFMNIIINAFESMPQGGTLTIATRLLAKSVEISFTDTGSGISPEHKSKIFDPYFTTKEEGTGLGLATVHRIVRDHGGSVEVDSQEGKGTGITIFLPGNEEQADDG